MESSSITQKVHTGAALKETFFSVGETSGIAFGHPLHVEGEVAQEKNHTPRVNGLVRGLEEETLEDCYISQYLTRKQNSI